MNDIGLFPTDITPKEQEAGFALMAIANQLPGHDGEKILAVVYQVDKSHRLVKTNILGAIDYNLQFYCATHNMPPHIEPSWKPLDFFFSRHDPITAVRAVTQWLMDNPPPKLYELRIPA
jgi:hypothetical protein